MYEKLVRNILYLVAASSFLYSGIFDNATMYGSVSMGTPYINGNVQIEDDYQYNFGIRKIALFPYQSRDVFYDGNEEELSDNALFGAVEGLEYLISASSIRNQGHEFIDQNHWFKWSSKSFAAKFSYVNKESRDLQYTAIDARYRIKFKSLNMTLGTSIKGHPVYGHPPIEDYEGYWWDLAYDYGYIDFMVPEVDLNQNGIIDDYYVWIETDPVTEEGYWIYFYEGINYYWENPDGEYVAGSDEEFYEYHFPHIAHMYNEDNKTKEWQAELSVMIGLDFYMGGDKYYSHIWANVFPASVGLTDKAFNGKDVQYDVGFLVGTNLSERIGVFFEGKQQSYYGKEEYDISTGVNWRF
tara:strand:+ start:3640 stop:4701 length:1062 start_codon:yes stop_codon:yes gene_type:complete